jgi:hypothetical protein
MRFVGRRPCPANRLVANEIGHAVNRFGPQPLAINAPLLTPQLLRMKLPSVAGRYVVTDRPATSAI